MDKESWEQRLNRALETVLADYNKENTKPLLKAFQENFISCAQLSDFAIDAVRNQDYSLANTVIDDIVIEEAAQIFLRRTEF